MDNLNNKILERVNANEFVINDLLFAKFYRKEAVKITEPWRSTDHIVYVVSGRKTWRSSSGTVTAEQGQAVFIKKGVKTVEKFCDDNYSAMVFFITNDFVRGIVDELVGNRVNQTNDNIPKESEIKLNIDNGLASYFQSMAAYFASKDKLHDSILLLKLKELIMSIYVGDNNHDVADYFQSLTHFRSPSIIETMELNFRKNLSMNEFAQLCHRSYSSFKRDFQSQYSESPGKWLLNKRLDYSVFLLLSSEKRVSDIVIDSGFVDISHYSKAFKKKFGDSPTIYRKNQPLS
jgi:AraC-like DNA-binding protein